MFERPGAPRPAPLGGQSQRSRRLPPVARHGQPPGGGLSERAGSAPAGRFHGHVAADPPVAIRRGADRKPVGDILSDESAALTRPLGLPPSGSLGSGRTALYGTGHGPPPGLAGTR